jgi:hypothetical protein
MSLKCDLLVTSVCFHKFTLVPPHNGRRPLDIPNELLDPRLLDPPAWEAMDCRGRVSRLCGYVARVGVALFTTPFCSQKTNR